MMLDKKNFESIRKEMAAFEEKREETISNSREVIKLSKQIIYSVHRNELKEAESLIKQIKDKIKKLDKTKNYDTGISSVAFQEYVEALVFYEFVKTNKVPSHKDLDVDTESYLLGLTDLTGELGRKAVHDAIKNDIASVIKVKELVEEIYGEFLKFDLRNSELRKKSDSIKWNLNKIEDLLFTMKGRA